MKLCRGIVLPIFVSSLPKKIKFLNLPLIIPASAGNLYASIYSVIGDNGTGAGSSGYNGHRAKGVKVQNRKNKEDIKIDML